MLRWLVRKVVKYALEELESCRPGQPAASGAAVRRPPRGAEDGSGDGGTEDVDRQMAKETMLSLASAAVKAPGAVESGSLQPGKSVVVDGSESRSKVDRLAKLGN